MSNTFWCVTSTAPSRHSHAAQDSLASLVASCVVKLVVFYAGLLKREPAELIELKCESSMSLGDCVKTYVGKGDLDLSAALKKVARIVKEARIIVKERPVDVYPLNLIADFLRSTVPERKQQLRNDSGLGLMLFCEGAVDASPTIPVHVIELDCRGDCQEEEDRIFIRFGEIKSSYGDDVKAQVRRTAKILCHAAKIKAKPEKPEKPEKSIHITALVFLPSSQEGGGELQGDDGISYKRVFI